MCRQFARGNWAGMKTRKFSKQKTEWLQEGDWDDTRFDRG